MRLTTKTKLKRKRPSCRHQLIIPTFPLPLMFLKERRFPRPWRRFHRLPRHQVHHHSLKWKHPWKNPLHPVLRLRPVHLSRAYRILPPVPNLPNQVRDLKYAKKTAAIAASRTAPVAIFAAVSINVPYARRMGAANASIPARVAPIVIARPSARHARRTAAANASVHVHAAHIATAKPNARHARRTAVPSALIPAHAALIVIPIRNAKNVKGVAKKRHAYANVA